MTTRPGSVGIPLSNLAAASSRTSFPQTNDESESTERLTAVQPCASHKKPATRESHNLFLKRSRNSSAYCNSWSVSCNLANVDRGQKYIGSRYILPTTENQKSPLTRQKPHEPWSNKQKLMPATRSVVSKWHILISRSGRCVQFEAGSWNMLKWSMWFPDCNWTYMNIFFCVGMVLWLRTLGTPPRAHKGTKELPKRCTVSLLVWFVTYVTV